jgi:hypothetical protein
VFLAHDHPLVREHLTALLHDLGGRMASLTTGTLPGAGAAIAEEVQV